jgi:hypothetical protein
MAKASRCKIGLRRSTAARVLPASGASGTCILHDVETEVAQLWPEVAEAGDLLMHLVVAVIDDKVERPWVWPHLVRKSGSD